MSNTIESVTTKSGNSKNVRAGHHQKNFKRGVVARVSALFMADVGEIAGIDTTGKESLKDVMDVCIKSVNDSFGSNLTIKDYDFLSGSFDRDFPEVVAQVQEVAQEVAQLPEVAQMPQMATADEKAVIPKPKIVINNQVVAYVKSRREQNAEFDTIREELSAVGNSPALIDAHFESAFPMPK